MPDFANDVIANLPRRQRRDFASILPPDLLAELEVIRADFRAGRVVATKTGLGKAVAISLAARGIECHPLTVVRWLDAR